MYHSKENANEAQAYFINTFSKKEIPTVISEFKANSYNILLVLVETKLVSSKSEARRVLEHGGVKVDGKVINEIDCIISPGSVLQKGKIHFLKII